MTSAARSVFIFGLYMLGQGTLLMFVPVAFLTALTLPAPTDAWVRVVGWALCVLGAYYVQAARENRTSFFKLSARIRLLQFLFFIALVVASLMPPLALAVSAVELASGVWTLLTLRAESRRA